MALYVLHTGGICGCLKPFQFRVELLDIDIDLRPLDQLAASMLDFLVDLVWQLNQLTREPNKILGKCRSMNQGLDFRTRLDRTQVDGLLIVHKRALSHPIKGVNTLERRRVVKLNIEYRLVETGVVTCRVHRVTRNKAGAPQIPPYGHGVLMGMVLLMCGGGQGQHALPVLIYGAHMMVTQGHLQVVMGFDA